MSALVGKTLKDYFVLRQLGQGAMAEVYLAQQLSLGRQVALKVLNPALARDPVYVERFHHEARAAAALVHAGIVQIYEVGYAPLDGGEGAHFIAQEYVPGRNLGELIHSRGRLDPALALDVLRQVAAALAKADSEGIVHRDIKPENIMLSRSGEVKVADFGLARVQGGGVNLTQIGVTMGTPLYMSPEQIEGRPLDSRSDIYSLGVTAYHMLAGQPPHTGDTPLVVAMQHLHHEPTALDTLVPNVPKPLAQFVHRMLAKQPEQRFVDAGELVRELHALAKQGASAGWANAPQDWSLSEWIAVADDRAAATERLGRVMKTAVSRTQRRASPGRRLALAALGAALVGLVAAAVLRPRSLLAEAASGPRPLQSAWAQLYQAKIVDTEQAWRAVEQYWPTADKHLLHLAEQGLANYYLFRSQEYQKALGPLEFLARLGSTEPALSNYGIAGLVVAHTRLGELPEARNENARLDAAARAQLDEQSPRMYDALEQALSELTRS